MDASSPATADRYEQRIRAFCERLEYGSERGTRRDEVKEGLRVIGLSKRDRRFRHQARPRCDFARVLWRR